MLHPPICIENHASGLTANKRTNKPINKQILFGGGNKLSSQGVVTLTFLVELQKLKRIKCQLGPNKAVKKKAAITFSLIDCTFGSFTSLVAAVVVT